MSPINKDSQTKENANKEGGKEGRERKVTAMKVPLLPLRDVIIFPHMVVPLFVGREKSINALEECVARKQDLFLVAQREATTVSPGESDIFKVGTLGTILQILRLPPLVCHWHPADESETLGHIHKNV